MSSILSISSNKSMNYLLKTVLEKKVKFIAASNVFEGQLELKRNPQIDIILIDIDNQLDDSLNFISHLKTSWLYYRPVIALTSSKDPKVIDQLIEAKVYEYFTKPFNPVELIQAIDELATTPTIHNI